MNGFITAWMVFAIALVLPGARGSIGNNLYAYQDCIYQCEQTTCYGNPDYYHNEYRYYNGDWKFDPQPLPKHLQTLQWDCRSNCDYQCQRIVTIIRKENDEEIHQFHGKWPFLRVYGIQEFVSVLFSLGNLWVHLIGFFQLLKYGKSTMGSGLSYSFANVLIVNVITMLAWVFSTVFHVRDFKVTEKLDYYFAGLTVLSSFHNIAARLFGLHRPTRAFWRWVLGAFCVAAYAAHIYRLETDWSYTYNMEANITVGVLQNVCLYVVVYGLYSHYYEIEQSAGTENHKSDKAISNDPETKDKDPEAKDATATSKINDIIEIQSDAANASLATDTQKTQDPTHLTYINFGRILLPSFYSTSPKLYSLYPLLLSTIVFLGMMLEVFDFPPIFFDLVDAHSLWHLVTIFPAYLGWYDWIIWDLDVNVRHEIETDKIKID